MGYRLLSSKETKKFNFRNEEAGYGQFFIFTTHMNELYVMAKSVVKGVIVKDYPYNKDPYIKKIIKLLAGNVVYFEISEPALRKTVWPDTPGNFSAVTFVKVDELYPLLSEIFPELDEDALHSLRSQLQGMRSQFD